jgi:translation initiation factor IF-2
LKQLNNLEKLSTDEVKVRVIHGAVGAISETDVTLAAASNALIIGFNVRPSNNASVLAEKEGVNIRTYRIIYDALDDIKSAMVGMLEPEYKEVILGTAEVRLTYKISNIGTVAGCYVLNGKIVRNSGVRIIRDGIVIFESQLSSLKRFKDDVKEVATGYECGITIEKFNDIKDGDLIEAYTMEEVKPKQYNIYKGRVI